MPKTASTAISKDQLLYTTSGAVSPLSSASDERIAGVSQRTVVAADADYAATAGESDSMIPVLIDEDGIWEVTPSSTTNTITNGTYLDWNNSTTVHVSNSTYDQFKVYNPSGATNLKKVRGTITCWEDSQPPATN
jgi:hypothetical protein